MFKIHEKLKKIRQIRGYNQADMAKQLGMSVASYSRIEAGKTNLNIDCLKKICKVLEIELIDLLENNIQFLAEPKVGYEKRATLKEHQEKKTIESLIEENNLLLKTMLNLLEQQKETNNKLLTFLIKRKK
ncbi:MAG: helix-turn-helix transcriptional regulator [Flavobacteriales bacterium]|nr:helix-turn-helix transcriptional regulator [Flavobacteriales bacterium]